MSRRLSIALKESKSKPKVKFPDDLVFLDNIKENNIKANQSTRFEFDLTTGYEMYNFKMQKLSYGKVVNAFNGLNNEPIVLVI